MLKGILSFLILFGLFFFSITAFRHTTEKEKWQLTKLIAFSTLCASLTMVALVSIVLIF